MNSRLLSGALLLACAPLTAQIPMSDFVRTYSYSTHTRGFFFQVPVDFTVVGLQVPDETNNGTQNAALYRETADPTVAASITPIFIKTGVPSSQRIPVVPPQSFKKGEWFAVLGACGTATTNMENSYGAATPYASRVLGVPISLSRMMLQAHIIPSGGVGKVYTNTSNFGRVRVYVIGQGEASTFGAGGGAKPAVLNVSDPEPPSIGHTASVVAMPGDPGNLGALLTLGLAQSNVPTPFGALLNLPHFFTVFVPGNIPSTGTKLSLPVPNDPGLKGANLYLQHLELQATTLSTGNGIHWLIGL